MRNKSNKKTAFSKGLPIIAPNERLEADFARVHEEISKKMDLVNKFEDLVAKKITVGYCPNCVLFEKCTVMRHLRRYDRHFCNLDRAEGNQVWASFAKEIVIVQDVKAADKTFCIN